MYTISKILPDTITYKWEIWILKKVTFTNPYEEWFGYKTDGCNNVFCDFHSKLWFCIKYKSEKYLYDKLKEFNLVVF